MKKTATIYLFLIMSLCTNLYSNDEPWFKVFPSAGAAYFETVYGMNVSARLTPMYVTRNSFFGYEQVYDLSLRGFVGRYGDWKENYQQYGKLVLDYNYRVSFIGFYLYSGAVWVNNESFFMGGYYDYDYNNDDINLGYYEAPTKKVFDPRIMYTMGWGMELNLFDSGFILRTGVGYPEMFELGAGFTF